jgi:hypothetical protein
MTESVRRIGFSIASKNASSRLMIASFSGANFRQSESPNSEYFQRRNVLFLSKNGLIRKEVFQS